jgi:hypothetical protein
MKPSRLKENLEGYPAKTRRPDKSEACPTLTQPRISGILAALLRLSPFGKTYQRSAKRNLQFRFEHH